MLYNILIPQMERETFFLLGVNAEHENESLIYNPLFIKIRLHGGNRRDDSTAPRSAILFYLD